MLVPKRSMSLFTSRIVLFTTNTSMYRNVVVDRAYKLKNGALFIVEDRFFLIFLIFRKKKTGKLGSTKEHFLTRKFNRKKIRNARLSSGKKKQEKSRKTTQIFFFFMRQSVTWLFDNNGPASKNFPLIFRFCLKQNRKNREKLRKSGNLTQGEKARNTTYCK